MNWLDLLVIVIMAGCIAGGAWRGFIRTVLGFASFILAIFLTNLLYPSVGRFLRGIEGLYTSMQTSIGRMLNLDGLIEQHVGETYNQIIERLPLPAVLQNSLIQGYNDEAVTNALSATGIADYISGFLAGIAINIISIIIVFVIVFLAIIFLGRALNLIAKLPVIRTLNKLLGAAIGAVWGLLLSWLVLGLVVIYFAASSNTDMQALLDTSIIAQPMHNANFVLHFILRLFP